MPEALALNPLDYTADPDSYWYGCAETLSHSRVDFACEMHGTTFAALLTDEPWLEPRADGRYATNEIAFALGY